MRVYTVQRITGYGATVTLIFCSINLFCWLIVIAWCNDQQVIGELIYLSFRHKKQEYRLRGESLWKFKCEKLNDTMVLWNIY